MNARKIGSLFDVGLRPSQNNILKIVEMDFSKTAMYIYISLKVNVLETTNLPA